MRTLQVDLGNRSYPIFIGDNLLNRSELLHPYIQGKQVLVVTNETIAPLYLNNVLDQLENYQSDAVLLPDGEEYKNIDNIIPILDKMMEKNFDRRVTIIALGGGVVGDMAGFAASIYRRGVNFIQIPTTLLAQVDSSVGGKTGVNHPLGKNMIGSFYQPQCVIADTASLKTLEDKQLSSGLAEVIKYALIDDIDFLDWIEKNIAALLNRESEALAYAIEKSCQAKAEIVAQDEKESGKRALLNLGHTFGHAIETALGYGNILHGEAISIGMMMAADLSIRHQWLNQEFSLRIKNLLQNARLPVSLPANISSRQMLELMAGDKKVLDGHLHLVLFEDESKSFVCSDYDSGKLLDTINSFVH